MSGEGGGSSSACNKCKTLRVKCDRSQPVCSRCARLGHRCEYPVRNTATAYIHYVQALEAEIAELEGTTTARPEQSTTGPVQARLATQDAHGAESHDTAPIRENVHSHELINDLFANTAAAERQDGKLTALVDGLAQVSLSAMTANGTLPSNDVVLATLILSAAMPPTSQSPPQHLIHLALPGIEIADRVCAKYCSDVLPEFPLLDSSEVQAYLHKAYREHHPYSIFVVATLLATTAIFLSPASGTNAMSLYHTGLQCLEASFTTELQRDPMRDLETTVILGHYASLVGSSHCDPWALSGLAVRIAVDLGLHKSCQTDRKQRLFWGAYCLDRKVATANNRPLGIPDKAIDTPLSSSLDVLRLYRIMSMVYQAKLCRISDDTDKDAVDRLSQWENQYRPSRTFSRWLEEDVLCAKALLQRSSSPV